MKTLRRGVNFIKRKLIWCCHFLEGFKLIRRVWNIFSSPVIYDVFVAVRGPSVCVIAPYYSLNAFVGSRCVFDIGNGATESSVESPVRIVDDPERSCLIATYAIPKVLAHAADLKVNIRRGRKALYQDDLINWSCHPRKYILSIATLIKYESEYLPEWIEHHLKAGVEHFYIYDNNTTDMSVKNALAPYVQRGVATYIPWPYRYRFYDYDMKPFWPMDSHMYCQIPQIHHALYRYAAESAWILNCDVDEYFYSPAGIDLKNIVSGYSDQSVLSVSGYYFGGTPEDVINISEKGVVGSFLRSEPTPTSPVKLIVNTDLAETVSIHRVLGDRLVTSIPPERIVFNHYRALGYRQRSDSPTTVSMRNTVLYDMSNAINGQRFS